MACATNNRCSITYPSLRAIDTSADGHLTYLTPAYFPCFRKMVTPPFHAGFVDPVMRALSAVHDASVHKARPLCPCFAHSAPRSTPLHSREQLEIATRAECDGESLYLLLHTVQVMLTLRFNGDGLPVAFSEMASEAHVVPQVAFLSACSFVWQG